MRSAAPQPTAAFAVSHVRYKVLALCVCLAAITYLDRVCISITAPEIMRELSLSPLQMSFVFSAFTDGLRPVRDSDRVVGRSGGDTPGADTHRQLVVVLHHGHGSRFQLCLPSAGSISVRCGRSWSVAERGQDFFPLVSFKRARHRPGNLLHGRSPGRWPDSTAGDRPPRAFPLACRVPHLWRGGICLGRRLVYGGFATIQHSTAAVSPSELEHIRSGRSPDSGEHGRVPWKIILRSRSILALCGMYFTQSYGFYFYITWFPTYLRSQGFSSTTLSVLSGLPLILSVAADLLGGLTTDAVSRRHGLRWGRCGVGGGALAIAGLAILGSAASHNPLISALLIGVAGASANFLLGASWGVCVDIAGKHAGVVTGCMNTAGQIGGTLSPIIVALAYNHFKTWSAPLILTGLLYLAGAACRAASRSERSR